MYRVLIAIDGNEKRAIDQANYVASLPRAADEVEAVLLFVFTEDQDVPKELEKFKSATRVGAIRRADETLEEAGVETTVVDDSGDAAADILSAAEEYDVDQIVLGRRHRSPVGKAIFGSVAQSVILNADHPVVIAGKGDTDAAE